MMDDKSPHVGDRALPDHRRWLCWGMRCTLVKEFRFEAAQTLPGLPGDHKWKRMHGHSFKLEIAVTGEVDPAIGWVYDHARISRVMKPLMDLLDHKIGRASGRERV